MSCATIAHTPDAVEKYCNKVIEAGGHIVYPASDELQLDLDTDAQWRNLENLVEQATEILGLTITVKSIEPSSSGLPHRHVTLTVPAADFSKSNAARLERIAIQLFLGSDQRREMHSIARVNAGVQQPTMLFKNYLADHKRANHAGDNLWHSDPDAIPF